MNLSQAELSAWLIRVEEAFSPKVAIASEGTATTKRVTTAGATVATTKEKAAARHLSEAPRLDPDYLIIPPSTIDKLIRQKLSTSSQKSWRLIQNVGLHFRLIMELYLYRVLRYTDQLCEQQRTKTITLAQLKQASLHYLLPTEK